MKIILVINLLCLLLQTQSKNFLFLADLKNEHKTSYFQCYKSSGFNSIGLSFPYYLDEFDDTTLQSIENAINAGVRLEMTVLPTRCRSIDK